MEESLKSARLVHRLIILVAATLIVVSMPQRNSSTKYADALAEFELLGPALERIPELCIEQLNAFYESQGTIQICFEAFDGLDLSGFQFNEEDELLSCNPPRFGVGTKTPLKRLYNYLLYIADCKLTIWNVDHKSLKLGLLKFRENHRDATTVIEVLINGFEYQSDQSWYHRREDDLAIRILATGGGIYDNFFLPDEGIWISHRGYKRETLTAAVDYLKKLKLLVEINGEREALPRLRNVWDAVKYLDDVGDIFATLNQKAQEEKQASEQNVTVVGLSLPSTLLTVFGPVLLLTLFLYLWAGVKHIESIKSSDPAMLSTFPWLATFDSRVGVFLLYCSLMVLPLTAIVLSVYSANFANGVLRLALTAAYLGSISIVAVFVLKTIKKINA